jgi:hypothetical protein
MLYFCCSGVTRINTFLEASSTLSAPVLMVNIILTSATLVDKIENGSMCMVSKVPTSGTGGQSIGQRQQKRLTSAQLVIIISTMHLLVAIFSTSKTLVIVITTSTLLVFKMDTTDSMVPKTETSNTMVDEILTSGQLVSKTPTSVVMVSILSTRD